MIAMTLVIAMGTISSKILEMPEGRLSRLPQVQESELSEKLRKFLGLPEEVPPRERGYIE
jgi:hypothetical protein